ncbi:uncharacterized protein LOC110852543 [Folsomia candida]|uniref:Uncharacterized protein n=1 Tax=Folsomia candida TaxID=158441 RepID=A0A226E5V2_FOLCA|nr:uncharacterized protein LOC110852543 [Folsomia candida]OXA51936.1 hypothetical protein Fcan01_13715 [Folsomia candida]
MTRSNNGIHLMSWIILIVSGVFLWESCEGIMCYSCTTIIDNGVTKPGNQTCTLFNTATEEERRARFSEICPPGVKVCSQSEKRGFLGHSSGSSYDIIQKGCYARSFVNKARFNVCENVGGASSGDDARKERICLCDTDYCDLMDVGGDDERGDDDASSSADGTSVSFCLNLITLSASIIMRRISQFRNLY